MKRTWLIMVAVCAAVVFTACGKKSDNTETTKPVVTETAPTATTEAKEPVTTPAATLEAPGNPAEFKICLLYTS